MSSRLNPESPIVLLHEHDAYHIEADGRFTDEVEVVKQVKTAEGVQESGQSQLVYSDSMQSIKVLEAYTETPDGKKIPVDKNKILTQESVVSAQAPMFSDLKIKVIVFPQVEVGSILHYRYLRTQRTPLFPGQFSEIERTDLSVPTDDRTVSVVAPIGLKLYTQAIDMSGGATTCQKAAKDKQCFVWKTKNLVAHPVEPLSVNELDYSPRVAISTFRNYAQAAAAYFARAGEKAKVTPKVQKLADSLTKGVDDKNKQAEILYNWVDKNIRYVAVYFGAGTVVPHSADTIIENRFGDCKDHVVLLGALLAAKGIYSTGALVNYGNTYWLPDVATIPGVFNHIITYIPSLHRYVDSTMQFARFGELPIGELGKTVLDVNPITGKKPLDTIALPAASITHSTVLISMKTQGDGTVEGSAIVRETGAMEIIGRVTMANLSEGQEAPFASHLLAISGQIGSGGFEKGDPRDLSKPYEYRTTFSLPNLIRLPGPGAFTFPTGFHSMSSIGGMPQVVIQKERNFALSGCADNSKYEDYTLELPMHLKITRMPTNVDVKTVIGSYKSTYELKDRTLHVVREFTMSPGTATCSLDQYKKLRALIQYVSKDLRAQVIYQ
jgi:transglutaminase-like putative cysteine protease